MKGPSTIRSADRDLTFSAIIQWRDYGIEDSTAISRIEDFVPVLHLSPPVSLALPAIILPMAKF